MSKYIGSATKLAADAVRLAAKKPTTAQQAPTHQKDERHWQQVYGYVPTPSYLGGAPPSVMNQSGASTVYRPMHNISDVPPAYLSSQQSYSRPQHNQHSLTSTVYAPVHLASVVPRTPPQHSQAQPRTNNSIAHTVYAPYHSHGSVDARIQPHRKKTAPSAIPGPIHGSCHDIPYRTDVHSSGHQYIAATGSTSNSNAIQGKHVFHQPTYKEEEEEEIKRSRYEVMLKKKKRKEKEPRLEHSRSSSGPLNTVITLTDNM